MRARIALLVVLALAAPAAGDQPPNGESKDDAAKVAERCQDAADLLDQIMAIPESAIPDQLLAKARCVALIPGVKKAGFVFAGKYGKGMLVCRGTAPDQWHGPSAVRLEGGSFGLQIGASSTDVVLLVVNDEGVEKLLDSKFTLGADASVAGGPVGRTAQIQTDAQMHAKILSYSRSRGLFAGLSLEGATLRPDTDANRRLYGRDVPAKEILAGKTTPPEYALGLVSTVVKHAPEADFKVSENLLAPQPPPPPPPKPDPTLLSITSEPPYAEVTLNRNFNGLTPRTKVVTPGEYEVTVTKAGFAPWTKTVTVPEGESFKVHADLEKAAATAARAR
jgi:lipid-binding SYLF domain-containing protein